MDNASYWHQWTHVPSDYGHNSWYSPDWHRDCVGDNGNNVSRPRHRPVAVPGNSARITRATCPAGNLRAEGDALLRRASRREVSMRWRRWDLLSRCHHLWWSAAAVREVGRVASGVGRAAVECRLGS